MLLREVVRVDLAVDPHAHETTTTLFELGLTRANLLQSITFLRLRFLSRSADQILEPGLYVLVPDPHLLEVLDDLRVEFGLGEAPPSVVAGHRAKLGAAVVRVPFLSVCSAVLGDHIAGQVAAAVRARDELVRVHQVVGLPRAPANTRLHSLPGTTVYDPLEGTGVPLAAPEHFADVHPARQDDVQLRLVEVWLPLRVDDPEIAEATDQRLKGVAVVGVLLIDPAHLRCAIGVGNDDATPVLPHVPVPEGRMPNWKARFDSPADSVSDVESLLFGEVGCHDRSDPPRHPSRWIVPRLLAGGDQGDAHIRLQPLQLDVIRHVSRSAVDLVDKDCGDRRVVLLHKLDHLAEGSSLMASSGGLGHLELPQDFASMSLRPAAKLAHLSFEAVAFDLLFTRTDAREDHVLLRDH